MTEDCLRAEDEIGVVFNGDERRGRELASGVPSAYRYQIQQGIKTVDKSSWALFRTETAWGFVKEREKIKGFERVFIS